MHCNRKCKYVDCEQYAFSLKGSTGTYYRQQVNLSFCPKLDKFGKTVANSFPIFNSDQKCFTPAFILDLDKNYTAQMEEEMKADQQRKIKEAQQSKREIFAPKPSHKNKYCSACKSNYEQYIDHIQSPNHKKAISKSRYSKHILDLCSTLFKTQQLFKSDRQETTKQKQDDCVMIRKKRKYQKKALIVSTPPVVQQSFYPPLNNKVFQMYQRLMFMSQFPLINLPGYFNYPHYPYPLPTLSQPSSPGFKMFIPQQTIQHQFPIMINNQSIIQ